MGSYFSWLSWSSSSSDPPKPHHHVKHEFEYEKERKKTKQKAEYHSIAINQNNHSGDISIGDIHFYKPIPSTSDPVKSLQKIIRGSKKQKPLQQQQLLSLSMKILAKLNPDFIPYYLHHLRRGVLMLMFYIRTQSKTGNIPIELVHDGLRAVIAINKNSLKVARLRFAEYYTKELMDTDDDGDGDDDDDDDEDGDEDDDEDMLDKQTIQDAAFSLDCFFESNCNWNNWDIIKMAFGIDLSDECIYIIRALNIHSNNLLFMTKMRMKSIATSYNYNDKAVDECWKFIKTLKRMYAHCGGG